MTVRILNKYANKEDRYYKNSQTNIYISLYTYAIYFHKMTEKSLLFILTLL